MTQRELAEPLTRAYVCAVERGRATPSLASLMLFADRLGVPVRSLIDVLELAATRTTGGFTRS